MPSMRSRGRGRRTINEINMVPFIDVMLVLLIIFMVTAPPEPRWPRPPPSCAAWCRTPGPKSSTWKPSVSAGSSAKASALAGRMNQRSVR